MRSREDFEQLVFCKAEMLNVKEYKNAVRYRKLAYVTAAAIAVLTVSGVALDTMYFSDGNKFTNKTVAENNVVENGECENDNNVQNGNYEIYGNAFDNQTNFLEENKSPGEKSYGTQNNENTASVESESEKDYNEDFDSSDYDERLDEIYDFDNCDKSETNAKSENDGFNFKVEFKDSKGIQIVEDENIYNDIESAVVHSGPLDYEIVTSSPVVCTLDMMTDCYDGGTEYHMYVTVYEKGVKILDSSDNDKVRTNGISDELIRIIRDNFDQDFMM